MKPRLSLVVLTAVTVILLLAAGLRFHRLGEQSFWNDEGNSYVQATRSFTDIAANAARDIHPPGYYWLLAVWRGIAGETEFALRALSVFASVVSVAFVYAIGKRLFGTVAGLAAALFTALNTFNIYYAQEARMYAPLALWSAGAMWALVGLLFAKNQPSVGEGLRPSPTPPSSSGSAHGRSPTKLFWPVGATQSGRPISYWIIALALFNAAGLYTQYAFPFVMLAEGVLAVLWLLAEAVQPGDRGDNLRGAGRLLVYYAGANLLALLLYLPWLPTALHQVTSWPNTGEPTNPAEALATILRWLAFGITDNPGALAVAVYFFLLFGLLTNTPPQKRGWWRLLLPVLWTALPVALFLALGMFRPANLKLLLPAQLGFALWLGRGAWVLWHLKPEARTSDKTGQMAVYREQLAAVLPRLAAGAGVLALAVNLWSGVPALYEDSAYQRDDYRGIVTAITAELRPGDAIILDAPNQEEVFRYYYRGDAPVYTLPPGLGGDDAETRRLVGDIINQYDRVFVVFWGEAERDPNRVVETTLDSQTYEAGQDGWYGAVRLARYVMPAAMPDTTPVNAHFGESITLVSVALSAETVQPGDVLQIELRWVTDTPLDQRFKVFLQLLDSGGVLAAQRDSEPGGGSQPTTDWTPGAMVTDNHGLLIPRDLPAGDYTLIIGLYDSDDPAARLPVGDGDYVVLGTIRVSST
ncbi:MAG: glycosyltransferase family 39 protein [Anaerolineaceae bacterium]|nr:glycosyltransferase family 39 protein [Anaerolineaceae bacterium]